MTQILTQGNDEIVLHQSPKEGGYTRIEQRHLKSGYFSQARKLKLSNGGRRVCLQINAKSICTL